jgi:hypothetical protein
VGAGDPRAGGWGRLPPVAAGYLAGGRVGEVSREGTPSSISPRARRKRSDSKEKRLGNGPFQ